jgi:hypothetical protein
MEPKKVMHSPVAASEPQPVQATDLRTPPDVLPLAASNLASEFLLEPDSSGGRSARKGFEFQDRYIAYALAGLLKDRENLLYVRIEGIEDLDALVLKSGVPVERYYQMKSISGAGRWSPRPLVNDGVLGRFFTEYLAFVRHPERSNREIEFVFVTDGEIAPDVRDLHNADHTSESLRAVFAALAFDLLTDDPSISSHIDAIRKAYAHRAEDFLRNTAHAGSALSSAIPSDIRDRFLEAGQLVSSHLHDFLKAIHYEPRAGFNQAHMAQTGDAPGILEEATRARLIAALDCSETDAKTAYDSLIKKIGGESQAKTAAVIKIARLIEWLGLRRRILLEEKPGTPEIYIPLEDQLDELKRLLQNERLLSLHGLARVGKSQLVSGLIESDAAFRSYFWFTFTEAADDVTKLCKMLAYWVGLNTGIWQPWDDAQTGHLNAHQLLQRLLGIPISRLLVVLDDAHKCADRGLLARFCDSIRKAWTGCTVIVISEENLPQIEQVGAGYMAAQGLSPKQAFLFMAKHGIDLTDSLIEFLDLVMKVGGHPMMLASVAAELPAKPTSEEVRTVKENLPSASTVAPFLSELSSRVYFTVLQNQEQRDWLSRLALLQSAFDSKAAMKIAALAPAIACTPADWRYLSIQVFERSGASYFTIPTLMRTVAAENAKGVTAERVMVEAARTLLDWGSTTTLDFFAFQTAIFYLLMAERYEEVAVTLVLAMRAILDEPDTYRSVSIQLLSINHPLGHRAIKSPNLRWHLILSELLLLQLSSSGETDRAVTLIKMMRSTSREPHFHFPDDLARATIYQFIAGVRFANCRKPEATMRNLYHFLWSGQNAIRAMLKPSDTPGLEYAGQVYDDAYPIPAWIDIELFHRVAVRLQNTSPLKPEALCHFYSEFGLLRQPSAELEEMFDRHSKAYKDVGYQDAYVATELGRATHACERQNQTDEPRKIVLAALSAAPEITEETRARTNVLIADTYYLEGNFEKAAETYEVVEVDPNWPDTYANHVRTRTVDSLLAAGKPNDAARYVVRQLRQSHRILEVPQAATLRAKAIYLLAKAGKFGAAIPLVVGLRRIARATSDDKLKWLYTFFAAWLFSQWNRPDPILPRVAISIQDLESIGLDPGEEALDRWRAEDLRNVKADLYLASSLDLSSRPGRALKFLRSLDPQLTGEAIGMAAMELASLELKAGKPDQAAALIHPIVVNAPDPAQKLRWTLAGFFPKGHTIPELRIRIFFQSALKLFDSSESVVILKLVYASKLLRYFAVYDARLEIAGALALSEQIGSAELQAELLWFKVIQHRVSFFTRQDDLARALWRLCEVLESAPQLSAQRQTLPEAIRIVCSGQAARSCMHAIASAMEAARSGGSATSFEFTMATCKRVLIDFGILDAPKTGEV